VAEPVHRTEAESRTAAAGATEQKPITGKALLDALNAEGIIGLWRDREEIADSSHYAKELRAAAETRS
jgi:hypothetical protein